MAYTSDNILSAFEATGIHPLNPRRVLNNLPAFRLKKAKEAMKSTALHKTPKHPRAVRRTELNLKALLITLPDLQSPVITLIEKLSSAAQQGLTDQEIQVRKINELEEALKQRQAPRGKGSRKQLTTAVAVSGAELLKLKAQAEGKGAGAKKSRVGKPRASRHIELSSSGSDTEGTDSDDSEESIITILDSESEGEAIVVNHQARRGISVAPTPHPPTPRGFTTPTPSPTAQILSYLNSPCPVHPVHSPGRRVLRPRRK